MAQHGVSRVTACYGAERKRRISSAGAALIRIEEKLGVSGSIEDYQLFGLRGFFVVAGDLRQSKPIAASVVASDDEELASAELLRRSPPDEPRKTMRAMLPGLDWRPPLQRHLRPCSPRRRRLSSRRPMKIRNCSQHIRRIVGGRTGGVRRSVRVEGIATKADGDDQKTGVRESLCLLLPALLVEASTMSEDRPRVPLP